jgi:hypothetical protein
VIAGAVSPSVTVQRVTQRTPVDDQQPADSRLARYIDPLPGTYSPSESGDQALVDAQKNPAAKAYLVGSAFTALLGSYSRPTLDGAPTGPVDPSQMRRVDVPAYIFSSNAPIACRTAAGGSSSYMCSARVYVNADTGAVLGITEYGQVQ